MTRTRKLVMAGRVVRVVDARGESKVIIVAARRTR